MILQGLLERPRGLEQESQGRARLKELRKCPFHFSEYPVVLLCHLHLRLPMAFVNGGRGAAAAAAAEQPREAGGR